MGHVSVALFGEKAKSGGKTPRKLAERHDNLRFGGKTPRKLAGRGEKHPIGAKTSHNSAERGGAEQIGAKIEGFDAEEDGEGKKIPPVEAGGDYFGSGMTQRRLLYLLANLLEGDVEDKGIRGPGQKRGPVRLFPDGSDNGGHSRGC